jgi:hypothetical protein
MQEAARRSPSGRALFFIVIGGGRGAKMPARRRFVGQRHCYFLVEYNGECVGVHPCGETRKLGPHSVTPSGHPHPDPSPRRFAPGEGAHRACGAAVHRLWERCVKPHGATGARQPTRRAARSSRQKRLRRPTRFRSGIRTDFSASVTAYPIRCATRRCFVKMDNVWSASAGSTT